MTRILFFDTETTGVPDKMLPLSDDRQPHIVQVAGILADDAQREYAQINLMTRPSGWTIPSGAAAVHGITDEIAGQWGMSEKWAVTCLMSMAMQADIIVGHNVEFDIQMVEIAHGRHGLPGQILIDFAGKRRFCTADVSTDLVNLAPTEKMIAAGFNKPKRPKLIEAYRFFFGEDFDGAHDALVDVRACARIYYHLAKLGGQ